MTTVNVTIPLGAVDIGGITIDDYKTKLKNLIPKALKVATRRTQARLKEITPVSKRPWERPSGGLRDSIKVYHSTTEMRAVWDSPYASYIDKGTPAHVVLPKSRDKALHWQPAPGVWGSSKGHMIRGISPHNLTEQAQKIMQEETETALITLILAEIGGITK